jgi:hypothetical protein
MSKPVPAFAAAALLLLAPVQAQAEPDDVRLSHPADTTRTYETPQRIEPFDLAVPLLSRDVPAPSYAPALSDSAAPDAPPQAEPMPGMDHGGMTH